MNVQLFQALGRRQITSRQDCTRRATVGGSYDHAAAAAADDDDDDDDDDDAGVWMMIVVWALTTNCSRTRSDCVVDVSPPAPPIPAPAAEHTVATHRENLEKSWNLRVVREKSGKMCSSMHEIWPVGSQENH